MNMQLEKMLLSEFEPGKRENAFYIESNLSSGNQFSIVSNEEHDYYVYVWDENKQKHVRRWVE